MAQVDFYNMLSGLGDTIAAKRKESARRQAFEDISDPNGSVDFQKAILGLARAGDLEGAKAVAGIVQAQHAGNSVYGTPIYGTRQDGSNAIGSFDKQGRFREIATPGFTPTPGIKVIDTGTGSAVIDSRTGRPVSGNSYKPPQPGQPPQLGATQPPGVPGVNPQPQVGYIPKDVEGEARAKKYGTEIGERQADLGKTKSALDTSIANLNALQLQANELLGHSGLSRITGMVGILPNVPGFPGADAQAKLDTLKAKVGFAALQAMREASKTGGALGQVSDFENKNLQNSMVELQNAQSEAQLRAALKKLVRQIDGMRDRLHQAYQTDYANIPRPAIQTDDQAAPKSGARPVTKTIGGKTYIQINGGWYER